uniref:type II secretion system F family protein n=1 Tax=Agathobacter sp. TaxID=2021311 RepID=UPI004056BE4B
MGKGRDIKIVIVFFLIPIILAAVYKNDNVLKNGIIERNAPLEDGEEVELVVNAQGLPEDYVYELYVEAAKYTENEAKQFFLQAIEEIEQDFEKITDTVPAKAYYVGEAVEASWSFSPSGYMDAEYHINQKEIPKEGILINAVVDLSCGDYEQLYAFAFTIEKAKLTEEEQVIISLDGWFAEQMQKEGSTEISLPNEINGISLDWSLKENHMFLKVAGLEIIILVLLYFREKEKQKEAETMHMKSIEQDYPQIVGSLSVLLGAGMTVKQAWNIMADQYMRKKEHTKTDERPAFEEMVLVNRKIQEGESEKEAFLQMTEKIPLMCYHKLIRMLLSHQEKGTKGLCEMLDKEAEDAYEQRILRVRKSAEEASTKMLIPMIMMLFIVMAIVLIPAFMNFSI